MSCHSVFFALLHPLLWIVLTLTNLPAGATELPATHSNDSDAGFPLQIIAAEPIIRPMTQSRWTLA